MTTKLEMLQEIDRIKKEIYRQLDYETRKALNDRFHELLTISNVNVTKGGTVRYYLTKNASYNVVEDYLVQLINANYDTLGQCL